jgi:hypothetical protein
MKNVVISDSHVAELKEKFKGKIILPKDPDYEQARQVYNAMINKFPALIVKCSDVADVIAAVNFGRENNLLVSVRGGGHNAGGLGICNDGLVIDLSNIKYVRVDTDKKTVRVGPGNTWAEVDHATHAFGLAVPSGTVSSTGVAGLTLGGGIGHLSRNFGLTIDNLLEADMVLADGSFVKASSNQNPELYWAIRGGGGNFGIVTSFLFKAHDVKMVYGGPIFWEIDKITEVMGWYHNLIQKAPKELNGFFASLIVPVPPFPEELKGKHVCAVIWCYTGDMSKAEEVFKPIINHNSPLFSHIGPMPYPAIQALFDPLLPTGMQWYWRADFFNDLSDKLADVIHKYGKNIPTALSQIHIYPISGEASRPGNSDTAWAYRDANYAAVIVGIDPDPANANKITSWTKGFWDAIHPLSSGGAYSNFMMDEGTERVKASYRENYGRLAKIKNKYDPDNFFRVNQNIIPVKGS